MPWYWDYTPSTPIAVKGGIKSRSQRGGFTANWWAEQWLAALTAYATSSRLQRGRSYARKGQVVALDIGKGEVRAEVQGSRATPYRISIKMKTLTEKQWQAVAAMLAANGMMLGRLLAGEMPAEMVAECGKIGISLFPCEKKDLTTKCSCPDVANPCKHLAAVFYLIGEELDRDPFLLLTLRGRTRDELTSSLRDTADSPDNDQQDQAQPLSYDQFWQMGDLPELALSGTPPPAQPALLVEQLGNPPLWRGEKALYDYLAPFYKQASARLLPLLQGEVAPQPLPEPADMKITVQIERPERSKPPGLHNLSDIYRAAGTTQLERDKAAFLPVLAYALAQPDLALSPPEKKAATFFLAGLSQTEIGRRMQISPTQVRTHLLKTGHKVRKNTFSLLGY